MFLVFIFIATLFFLFGSFFLTAVISAFRRMYKKDAQKQINSLGPLFFYRPFHRFLFSQHDYEGLFFTTICAQNLARFGYAACGMLFLLQTELFHSLYTSQGANSLDVFWIVLSILVLILASFVISDYLPRIFGTRFPEKALQMGLPLSSIFLFLAFPLAFVFLKISQSLSSDLYFDYTQEPSAQAKQEIIELIQEAEVPTFDIHDKKLIESVFTFKERCAREIMVPRVDVFSLSASTSIKEAARLVQREGYSRIPIYRNTVDNIVGVLMYKDVLRKFVEFEEKCDPKILEPY